MIDEKLIIDIRDYIKSKTGILYFKNIKRLPDNLMITCPFHKQGQENRPSSGIRLTEDKYSSIGTFHCFTCGETMDISQMVERILGPLYDEDEIESLFGLKTLVAQSLFERPQHQSLFKIPESVNINESILTNYRYYSDYLKDRNISIDTANIYDIGFDKENNQITFPLRDINRKCLGIGRRSIDKKLYRYPIGMQKPLYGIYELSSFIRYLYITEGPFNLWSLKEYNKEGVALLGTGTDYQYKELLKIKCDGYILALDGDTAGRNGNNKLGNFLIANHKRVFVALVPDNEDINSMTRDQFRNMEIVSFKEWQRLYKFI